MAIEIQLEKLRVAEAMNARDVLVQKLSDAYTSVREKTELIERLQQALNNGNSNYAPLSSAIPWDQTTEVTGLRAQVAELETLVQDLRIGSRSSMGPPPRYEEEEGKACPRLPRLYASSNTLTRTRLPITVLLFLDCRLRPWLHPRLPAILRFCQLLFARKG